MFWKGERGQEAGAMKKGPGGKGGEWGEGEGMGMCIQKALKPVSEYVTDSLAIYHMSAHDSHVWSQAPS